MSFAKPKSIHYFRTERALSHTQKHWQFTCSVACLCHRLRSTRSHTHTRTNMCLVANARALFRIMGLNCCGADLHAACARGSRSGSRSHRVDHRVCAHVRAHAHMLAPLTRALPFGMNNLVLGKLYIALETARRLWC